MDSELKNTILNDEEQRLNNKLYPELVRDQVKLVDAAYFGKAVLPWSVLSYTVDIINEKNKPIYKIRGSKVQCQTCIYPLPFGFCREAVFEIQLYEDGSAPVGWVFKQYSGCQDQCISNAPSYILEFPQAMDWKSKLLIIAGVQLLDMYYFQSMSVSCC